MKQRSVSIIRLTLLLTVVCGVFLVASCKKQPDGLVLMTDDSYRATVFASNKIGFGAPDGILWNRGKLYLADEGTRALEVWSKDEGMKKLMDPQFGIDTPEDLVIDADGNIFFFIPSELRTEAVQRGARQFKHLVCAIALHYKIAT